MSSTSFFIFPQNICDLSLEHIPYEQTHSKRTNETWKAKLFETEWPNKWQKLLDGFSRADTQPTKMFEWMQLNRWMSDEHFWMDEEIFEQLAVIYKVFLASKSWSKFTAWARYLQLSIQKQQTVRNVLAWEVPYE